MAMKRMGRPSLGFTSHIPALTISEEMDEAIATLQFMSGLSKAAIVREALAHHLVRLGLLAEQDLPATLTTRKDS